jgi:transposase-like protein
VNAATARAALDDLAEKCGTRYAAVIRLWENAWNEFIPFLDYDIEIRRPERLRHNLQRPVPGRRDLLTQPPETPFSRDSP